MESQALDVDSRNPRRWPITFQELPPSGDLGMLNRELKEDPSSASSRFKT